MPDTSFPILVAQEMAASFTSPFIAFMARVAKRVVHEAADGSALAPGAVTIVPGGRSWSLGRDAKGAFTTMLGRASQGAANSGLASAMATARAPLTICLSGEAHATEGVAAIGPGKAATLWVQAPVSCVVPDLPQAMIASGSRTVVLSPSALLAALRQLRARNAA